MRDNDESKILGELNDLEEEIEAITGFIDAGIPGHRLREFRRTLKRLQDAKYHQESRLQIHRQKVKESGVKY